MRKQNVLQVLPVEILHHVFEYFDIQDLGHASRVSHLWHQLSKLDLLWKSNSKKYFHEDNTVSSHVYEYYKSLVQKQPRMQLFALQGIDSVYSFDPFSRFYSRGVSVDDSMREFWNVMSFLGVQHEEHADSLIEARPHRGDIVSSVVREGLFVNSIEESFDVYLIYYCNFKDGNILNYPITCFCPTLEILTEFNNVIPTGDMFAQQSSIEREMATKMQAVLSAKVGECMRFIMWDKSHIQCTKMHRIIDTTNYEEENDQGKSKRIQYWFGGVPCETEEEPTEPSFENPLFVYAQ